VALTDRGRARLARWGTALAGAAYVAVAGSAFSATWDPGTAAVMAVGATLLATAVVAATLRLPPWLAALVAAAGYAGLGPLVVAAATGTAPAWTAVLRGSVEGWRAALATTVPAPEDPALLAVPLLVTWTAAALTARLVLASAARATSLAPGAAVLVVAGLYALDGLPLDLRVGALVLLAGALLALRARSAPAARVAAAPSGRDGRSPAGRAAEGVAGLRTGTVAGLAVVVALAGMAAAGAERIPLARLQDPATLRDRVDPPSIERALLSPLADVRRLQQREADEPQLRVRADGPLPKRLRLATLDGYDGVDWSSSVTFRPAGAELPVLDEVAVPTRALTLAITWIGFDGPLVPTAGVPTGARVRDEDGRALPIRYDPASGTLVAEARPSGGESSTGRAELVTPAEADVEARVPEPAPADYLGAAASGDPRLLPYVELPTPADEAGTVALAALTELARDATTGAVSPFSQITLLQQAFDERFEVAPTGEAGLGYGGHGLFLVNELLDEDGRVQAPDQLAGAFALAARTLRLPSRVATGFALPAGTEPGTEVALTGADAEAWPEVYLRGLGWVAVDLAATRGETPDDPAEDPFEEAQDLQPMTVDEGAEAPEPVDPFEAEEEAVAADREAARTDAWRWAIAAAVLVVALAAAVRLLGWWRRQRRRRAEPPEAVVGAWLDALERLDATGTPPARRTAEELVAVVAAERGPEVADPLAELARHAQPVLYGSAAPSAADADDAWGHADAFRRASTRALPRGRRLRLAVDPRRDLRSLD
jgi:transglutaminase-like putative cysteine protease